MSNLNGRYLSGELPEQYIYQGMYWGEFRGAQYSLLRARMLVRPREQISPLLLDEIFTGSPPKSERDILPVITFFFFLFLSLLRLDSGLIKIFFRCSDEILELKGCS